MNHSLLVLPFALVLTLGSPSGCGGGGGGGGSGVDGSKNVNSLSTDEKGKVCDWVVSHLGGYGADGGTCDQTAINAPASKDDCTTSFPTCSLTVAQFEACSSAVFDAQKTCTEAALTAAFMTPACMAGVAANCFQQQ